MVEISKFYQLLILSFLMLSSVVLQAGSDQVTATPEMKEEFQAALPKKMADEENRILKELYEANRESALKQGFNEEASSTVTLEAFHADVSREDYKFISEVIFKRSCEQISKCVFEQITLSIEGVTMFAVPSKRLGYVIPKKVQSSFTRVFKKGGGASVGGRNSLCFSF